MRARPLHQKFEHPRRVGIVQTVVNFERTSNSHLSFVAFGILEVFGFVNVQCGKLLGVDVLYAVRYPVLILFLRR